MERKIGEIFEHDGEWYQCVELDICEECSLTHTMYGSGVKSNIAFEIFGNCSKARRTDNKHAIFKKLEKVGEPFSCNYYGDSRLVMMQEYQLFDLNVIYYYHTPPMYITDYKHKRIAIEIKQTKEDMEGKKIQHYDCFFDGKSSKSNLKLFDLEAAKAGKSVCTRDGRKARIICFDAINKSGYPIIALIEDNGYEAVFYYNEDGKANIGNDFDLMMLPEKHEGWVNVYKASIGYESGKIYDSKEKAVQSANPNCIATVKIQWEE